jgi:hypothetical protein
VRSGQRIEFVLSYNAKYLIPSSIILIARLEEKLPLSSTLADFDLQEITVVSKTMKINSSVSSADIMAMQMTEEARAKGFLDSSFKHSRSVRFVL